MHFYSLEKKQQRLPPLLKYLPLQRRSPFAAFSKEAYFAGYEFLMWFFDAPGLHLKCKLRKTNKLLIANVGEKLDWIIFKKGLGR